MTRLNQLYIDHTDGEYTCRSCDRDFNTLGAVLQHCRHASVHSGEWCERCEWLFISPKAYQSHEDNSSHHNICNRCSLDFASHAGLIKHNTEAHYECSECDASFDSENSLQQHGRTHLPQEVECFGCNRQFREHAAMMLHLESGTCPSDVDRADVDRWIFDGDYCDGYLNDWDYYRKYTCPQCNRDFKVLSGLLQHVESNACNEDIDDVMADVERDIAWHIG